MEMISLTQFFPVVVNRINIDETSIPAWIKNNAGWWATDQIDDSSFLQGIQYLDPGRNYDYPPY